MATRTSARGPIGNTEARSKPCPAYSSSAGSRRFAKLVQDANVTPDN